MLVDLVLPVDRRALELNGRTPEQAIEEANRELAVEAKKHFGAGRITVGRLEDGRWFFNHLALGTMVRVPEELSARAAELLKNSILPAVRIHPAAGAEPVPQVHGIWAKHSWLDRFLAEERATIDLRAAEEKPREAICA